MKPQSRGRREAEEAAAPTKSAKARFAEIALVCAKCAKRQGMSKRGARDLLKRGLKARWPERRVKIVETGCLGPCPKRALAVATGGSVAGGRILLLDPAMSPEGAAAFLFAAPKRPGRSAGDGPAS